MNNENDAYIYSSNIPLSVGQYIKLSCLKNKITQQELAKAIGISPTQMSKYIKGKSIMSVEMFCRVCVLLKKHPDIALNIILSKEWNDIIIREERDPF